MVNISIIDKVVWGGEIVSSVDCYDVGFEDYVVIGKMIVKWFGGISVIWEFEMNILELWDDGDKCLVVFL